MVLVRHSTKYLTPTWHLISLLHGQNFNDLVKIKYRKRCSAYGRTSMKTKSLYLASTGDLHQPQQPQRDFLTLVSYESKDLIRNTNPGSIAILL